MGRALRLHHPGSAFHVVARTQGKEPWFVDDLKDRIADILLAGAASVGARPTAFAVMDNHLHLLLFQGRASLGETMQPIMRRIAVLVQKHRALEGHVFERRYRAKLCCDSEHLPNAILYVHRNPVKAGICASATDYSWSSARAFSCQAPPGFLAVTDGLRAFDPDGFASINDLRDLYHARLHEASDSALDDYWSWFMRSARRRRRDSLSYVPQSHHTKRAAVKDIRDVALVILKTIDRTVDVEMVRSRYGGAAIVAIRNQLVSALIQRDYAGVDISRYLRVSEAKVSVIRSAMRWGRVPGMPEAANTKD
jgi:putative transposase